jgi:DNA invertase Pin-like site-specific DNA recombinase
LSAHFGKYVAYYRVSTDKQGQSGLGLDAQRQAVMTYLNGGPWKLIGERTEAALAAAKRRGVKLGGPRLAAARKASIKVRSEVADAFAANVRPIIKEIQASGVSSLRGVARALTARGVPTARGGSWSDVMVTAVLRR